MFETLTYYIPSLEKSDFGKWVLQTEFPFVLYNWEVRRLAEKIDEFVDGFAGRNGFDYCKILEESNITWSMKSMKAVDASLLEGRTIVALLLGAVRAEKYCDGALLEFCESGCVLRWLNRIKEIDDLIAGKSREMTDFLIAK